MRFEAALESQLRQMLTQTLDELNLILAEDAQAKIIEYLLLLDHWNKRYNLTAIRDPKEMMIKHIADSLAVAPYLEGVRIIDVGTGAGLPGVPLSCVFPNWQWTLLDSNGKKTRFLIHVKAQLKLENIEIVQSRVEDFRDRNCFDGVITRAWTQLAVMLEKTRHLYCDSGKLWALKGAYPTEELKGLQGAFSVYPLKVPGLFEQRHLVCVYIPSPPRSGGRG